MAKYANGKFTIKNAEKYIGKRVPTYRSSWEFAFMNFCDNNPAVTQWASESIQIPYFNPVLGRQTIYVPDFVIVYQDVNKRQHVEVVEIKPLAQVTMESAKSLKDKYSVAINMAKWAAADAWCKANNMRFRVVTEHDIFKNLKR
jgi:hypothetical protein